MFLSFHVKIKFFQIGKLYPGCTLELRMNSTVMPVVKIGPGLLEADFAGDIAFYAHTNNGKIAYLLTLGVVSDL